MALARVMEAIGEKVARAVDGVRFFGPDQERSSDTPQVYWDPKRGEYQHPTRIGGGPGDDGDILRRFWTVEVEFWGGSFDETEALVDAFLAAAHDLLSHHSYRPPPAEEWNTGASDRKGSTCRLAFAFVAPVRRTPIPTVNVEKIVARLKAGDTTQVPDMEVE